MILDKMQDTFIEIGRIMKPFGIKGELKVHFYIDDVLDLKDVKVFYVKDKNQESGYKSLEFKKISFDENPSYAKVIFSHINDRTEAEAWRLQSLYIEKSLMPVLNKGEYFIKDLLDLEVIYNHKKIGKIINILDVGGQDIFVVEIDDGKQDLAIPFNDFYLKDIFLESRQIVFNNLDELF